MLVGSAGVLQLYLEWLIEILTHHLINTILVFKQAAGALSLEIEIEEPISLASRKQFAELGNFLGK
jgi:hypothetical protein